MGRRLQEDRGIMKRALRSSLLGTSAQGVGHSLPLSGILGLDRAQLVADVWCESQLVNEAS